MLLSNISIKSRLLILCLIPTLVIVALCASGQAGTSEASQ